MTHQPPLDPPSDSAPPPQTFARSTVNIAGDLLAVSRAAVRLVRAKTGRHYSLRQFTEEAFATQIQVIADTYNEGRAIPPDETPLERGAASR